MKVGSPRFWSRSDSGPLEQFTFHTQYSSLGDVERVEDTTTVTTRGLLWHVSSRHLVYITLYEYLYGEFFSKTQLSRVTLSRDFSTEKFTSTTKIEFSMVKWLSTFCYLPDWQLFY